MRLYKLLGYALIPLGYAIAIAKLIARPDDLYNSNVFQQGATRDDD